MRVFVALAAFHVGWFACVLGAAHGASWLGLFIVMVLAIAFVGRGPRRCSAFAFLASCGLLGFALDSTLVIAGLLRFPRDGYPHCSPLWMTALWVNFAAFVPVGLRWLYGRPTLAASLGAVSGPTAYWAGHGLGSLEWAMPQAAGAVATEWAAATPAIVWLASRMERGGRSE